MTVGESSVVGVNVFVGASVGVSGASAIGISSVGETAVVATGVRVNVLVAVAGDGIAVDVGVAVAFRAAAVSAFRGVIVGDSSAVRVMVIIVVGSGCEVTVRVAIEMGIGVVVSASPVAVGEVKVEVGETGMEVEVGSRLAIALAVSCGVASDGVPGDRNDNPPGPGTLKRHRRITQASRMRPNVNTMALCKALGETRKCLTGRSAASSS